MFDDFFEAQVKPEELDETVRTILQEQLSTSLAEELRRHRHARTGMPLYSWAADGDVRAADLKFIEAEISQQRDELARRYVVPMEEWAEGLLARYKLPQQALRPLMFGLAQVR
ncbi:MAG: hypothetical protein JO299_09930, partial [Gammaproteobacteria bacterium]|nr:hypothetical protein [Gammaproteobacteria bacterium]